MDKKVSLQDIVAQLATREKMTKKKAEALVRGFFDVIAEGLARDKYVRIKGFGTFKIITVSERASINIKTGERFQIGSHAKVTFTPDAVLKDLVNRPFAQFHTVILNEGVDETLLAEAAATAMTAIAEEEPAAASEVPTAASEVPTAASEMPTAASEMPTAASEMPTAVAETQVASPQEEEKKEEEPQATEEAPAVPVEAPAAKEEPQTSSSQVEKKADDELPAPEEEATVKPHEPRRKLRLWAWLGAVAVVAVVVLGLVLAPRSDGQKATEQPRTSAAQPVPKAQAQTQKPAAPTATPPVAPGKFTILLMQGVPQDAATDYVAQMKAAGFPDAEVTTYNGYVAIIYGHFPTHQAATERWKELKANSYFRQSLPAELK